MAEIDKRISLTVSKPHQLAKDGDLRSPVYGFLVFLSQRPPTDCHQDQVATHVTRKQVSASKRRFNDSN